MFGLVYKVSNNVWFVLQVFLLYLVWFIGIHTLNLHGLI